MNLRLQIAVDLIPILKLLSVDQRKGLSDLLEGKGAIEGELEHGLKLYLGPFLQYNKDDEEFVILDASWHRRAIKVSSEHLSIIRSMYCTPICIVCTKEDMLTSRKSLFE